jgi:hypothetical protein
VTSSGRSHNSDSTSSGQTVTAPPNTPSKLRQETSKSDSNRPIAKSHDDEEEDEDDDLSSPKRTFKLIQIAETLRVVLTSPVQAQHRSSSHEQPVTQTHGAPLAGSLRIHNLDTEDFERVEKWRYQVEYQRISNPLEMAPSLPFQGLFGSGLELRVGLTPNGVLTPSILVNHPSTGHVDKSCRIDGVGVVPATGEASARYIDLLGGGSGLEPSWQNDAKLRGVEKSASRPKFLHKLFL